MHNELNDKRRQQLVFGWHLGKFFLLLVILGLAGLIIWRANQTIAATNLLSNPGFAEGLTGWAVLNRREAQVISELSTLKPTQTVLKISIPDAAQSSLAGVGQRVAVAPLQRFRVVVNYQLIQIEQSSAQLVLRIAQFDQAGQLIKTDEFSSPEWLVAGAEQQFDYNFITHWQTVTVEIGLGLLGQQATTVEVSQVRLQLQPTWWSNIIHDGLGLPALVLLFILVSYVAWPPVCRGVIGVARKITAERPLSLRRELIWITLFYSLLTLALTYPLIWQLTTAVGGVSNWDPLQFIWYQWWVKEALLQLGVWPDQVTHLYYPLNIRFSVLAQDPYVAFVCLPFTLLLGPLFSYNVALLLSFVLAGVAGYLLCRFVSGNVAAAIIGGLIFAIYPNRVGHAVAGHLHFITNYFLPLYALSLLILLRRPSARLAIWHGIITVLLATSQPMHIGYGIIPVLLVVGGGQLGRQLWSARGHWQQLGKPIGWLLAANLLALFIFLPFGWSTLQQVQQGELGYLQAHELVNRSTDLLAFILPSPFQPFLPLLGLPPTYFGRLPQIEIPRDLGEPMHYLGVTVIVLVGLAGWQCWQKVRLWLVLAVGCGLLSLGPWLKIGGQVQPVSLPYAWVSKLPFFAWSRTPGRLDETMNLGLIVVTAIGVGWLLQLLSRYLSQSKRITQYSLYALVVAGLASLIFVEYWVIFPFPTEELPVPKYYHLLANETLEGGVISLPRHSTNYAMFYQTVHEHPLAGGYIHRNPTGAIELRRFLDQLLAPLPSQTVFVAPDEEDRRAILADMRLKRVIATPAMMGTGSNKKTLDYLPGLLGSPIFADGRILVYIVPISAATSLPNWQILPERDNWEVVEEGTLLRLTEDGNLFVYSAQAGPAELQLQFDPPATPITLHLKLNNQLLPNSPINVSGEPKIVPLLLRSGFNYLELVPQPEQAVDFRKIVIAAVGQAF